MATMEAPEKWEGFLCGPHPRAIETAESGYMPVALFSQCQTDMPTEHHTVPHKYVQSCESTENLK